MYVAIRLLSHVNRRNQTKSSIATAPRLRMGNLSCGIAFKLSLACSGLPEAAARYVTGMKVKSETPVELSVLMVSWNTCSMTLEALRSLYAQTHDTKFEVLLVDNGSSDGTAAAVSAEFPEVKLLAEKVNHGFAQGNNIAAATARGDYLLLLNTDTIILDGAIDRLMTFARNEPQARIWGGTTYHRDGRINPTSAWGRITVWSSFCIETGLTAVGRRSRLFNPEGVSNWGYETKRQVDVVSGCFFLIEASLWKELGGFDSLFFMYGEEADLCARARALGARPMVTPDARIVHHGGGSATKRAQSRIYISAARITLARRHLSRISSRIVRRLIIAGALWRALLYRVAARVRPARFQISSAHWQEVWARRNEWENGYAERSPMEGNRAQFDPL